MPMALGVLPRNHGRLTHLLLLAGGPPCGKKRLIVARKGLGKDVAELVGPSAVMLNDPVRDLAHPKTPSSWPYRTVSNPDRTRRVRRNSRRGFRPNTTEAVGGPRDAPI